MDHKTTTDKPVVLVVDDDELLRFNAVDILERTGFEIKEADCAEDALKILEGSPGIQLIFTDIQMPGAYDGMELVRRVHARWPHIRLIVTSGQLRPARSEIPDDSRFIAKPYPARDLLAQVNDLLHAS